MFWDYFAAANLLIGYLLIGKKVKLGWVFSVAGNLSYLFVGMKTGLYAMATLSAVMSGVAAYTWFKWKNEERKPTVY